MSDFDYVLRIGEEVREGLFPRPRPDGREPYGQPVAVDYRHSEEATTVVRFIALRPFHWIDSIPKDVPKTDVIVLWGEHTPPIFAGLEFDKEPNYDKDQISDWPTETAVAFHNLLRAVTGTLTRESVTIP